MATLGYKRILCAIEHDKDADVLLSLAGSAAWADVQLHVVSVSEANAVGGESTYQTFLKGIEERVRFSLGAKPCRIHTEFGNAKEKILEVAADIDPDLIILGTHTKSDTANLLFGSTANHVLHYANCDVLAVRLQARPTRTELATRYQRVTIALDMHDTNSGELMTRAHRVAENATFSLFNVLRLDECITQERLDSGCLEQAYYRLEAQMRQLGERFGIPIAQQKIFVGTLGEALHALEQAEPVDLLVLGNHREGESLVMPVDALSSTLRSTHSDVLVVR